MHTVISKALVLLSLGAQVSGGSQTATLEGHLVTGAGRPAPNYNIEIIGVYPATPKAEVLTDKEGHFEAPHLAAGEYVIFPYDLNDDRYPNRRGVFLDAHPDRVTLAEGQRLDRILVLPLPAGILKGSVLGADDLPVRNPEVLLCHYDDATRTVDFLADEQGKFYFLCPLE